MGNGVSFVDNSQYFKAALESNMGRALEECGLVAEGYAQVKLTEQDAVDTGNLRNSITHKVVMSEKACYIGTNVRYAKYIEYGTGIYSEKGGRQTSWTFKDEQGNWHRTNGMKPRPYLRPAVADNRSVYKQIIEDNLKN